MAKATSNNESVFDLARIRSLIELMKEHDLSEVDLCQADQQIRLARGTAPVSTYVAAPAAAAPPPAVAPAQDAGARPAAPPADGANIVTIKSPMVGTFYSRSNPNSPALVKVGDHVTPEKTVCIIEAMKVFNEIPAEVRGKIVAVLVNDEEAVEFNKPLFKVDTSA